MNAQPTSTSRPFVQRGSRALSALRLGFYLATILSALVTFILAAVVISTQKSDCKQAFRVFSTRTARSYRLIPVQPHSR